LAIVFDGMTRPAYSTATSAIGNAEVTIANRVYRVRTGDLGPG
jgi:hypothetical protein